MTPDEIRTRHYTNLNSYRLAPGYREAETPAERAAALEQIIGNRWEIDAGLYGEFLRLMPPVDLKANEFYFRDFILGEITSKYTREGGKFYCEFARYSADAPYFSDDELKALLLMQGEAGCWETRQKSVINELNHPKLADIKGFTLRLYKLDESVKAERNAAYIASLGFRETTPELLEELAGQRVEVLTQCIAFGNSITAGRLKPDGAGGILFIPKGKRTKGYYPRYLRKA